MATKNIADLNQDYREKYGFSDPEAFLHQAPKGLDHETVEMISRFKDEPDWMREFRHRALDTFLAKPMPKWGNQDALHGIDFDGNVWAVGFASSQAFRVDPVMRCRPGTVPVSEGVTVPDQRCTATLRFALHRIRDRRARE